MVIRLGLNERVSTPLFDFDGDRKTDISVYRPASNTNWILLRSSLGAVYIDWGLPTDVPAPADYDGDHIADVTIYRNGRWEIQAPLVGDDSPGVRGRYTAPG